MKSTCIFGYTKKENIMENLKSLIEKSGFTVKGVNQHKVLAIKNGEVANYASCIQVLAIKLGL